MKKTVLSVVLGASTLALTACGGSSNSSPTQSAPTVTANTGNTNTGNANNTTTHTPPPVTKGFDPYYYPIWSQEKHENFGGTATLHGLTVNGSAADSTTIDLKKLSNGLHTYKTVTDYKSSQALSTKDTEIIRIYKQPNSIVIGRGVTHYKVGDTTFPTDKAHGLEMQYMVGNATTKLPEYGAGTYHYTGKAFDRDSEGSFKYQINFDNKQGEGEIKLDGHTITLLPYIIDGNPLLSVYHLGTDADTTFKGFGILGGVKSTDPNWKGEYYKLGIFGNNAQEVAGHIGVTDGIAGNDNDILFGGSTK